MKQTFQNRSALLALLLLPAAAWAFPPAPSLLIYGLVKDQYGTPLINPQAKVLLQTSNGVRVATTIVPNLAIGINYALEVPMDAGFTPEPYKSNALLAGTPFKLYVVIGAVTNVPLQMTGGFVRLGQPAQQMRYDLTLGVDANGDGIPDAWESLFLAQLGLNLELASLNPNSDYAHDGLTMMQEYLLGNYPLNPPDSFTIRLISPNAGAAILEFDTIVGRSYTVLGSADLQTWAPVSFILPSEGTNPAARSYYYASDIQTVHLQVVLPTSGPAPQFFRLQLQ